MASTDLPKPLKKRGFAIRYVNIEMFLIRMYILRDLGMPFMHAHVHSNSGAGVVPVDRAGDSALPSDGNARRRLFPALSKLRPTAFKPVTYSIMHLAVAVSVAYVLTRDWRIALGVGIIEPMVQTVAYMLHEKAWARGGKRQAETRDSQAL